MFKLVLLKVEPCAMMLLLACDRQVLFTELSLYFWGMVA